MAESDTSSQERTLKWLNRNDRDASEVRLGDRVTFEDFGRKVLGTVTRCDEDGITIREEPPYTDPCATCRIRDEWCCDPWETRDEHEGEAE